MWVQLALCGKRRFVFWKDYRLGPELPNWTSHSLMFAGEAALPFCDGAAAWRTEDCWRGSAEAEGVSLLLRLTFSRHPDNMKTASVSLLLGESNTIIIHLFITAPTNNMAGKQTFSSYKLAVTDFKVHLKILKSFVKTRGTVHSPSYVFLVSFDCWLWSWAGTRKWC